MVDVGSKQPAERIAVAEGYIDMLPETLALIQTGGHQKGDVLGIARIAGIMASKRTADLIPLCHPIALSHVGVKLEPQTGQNRVRCVATAKTVGTTGVEMEALTAVQIALLTIYDMCKAVDRGYAYTHRREILIRGNGQVNEGYGFLEPEKRSDDCDIQRL